MTDSINPFEVCADNDFCVDDNVITELARIGASGDAVTSRVGGTYLKVLVGRARFYQDHSGLADVAALDAVNVGVYRAVLAGVTTADCADDTALDRGERSRRSLERNRRSNFARTAVSTLRTWLGVVPDATLAELDPALVTKATLIDAINTARARARDTLGAGPLPGEDAITASRPLNDMERKAALAYKRLVSALRTIKASDPQRAKFLSGKITTGLMAHFENGVI